MSSLRLIILTGILIAVLVLSAGCTQQSDKTVKKESNTATITSIATGTTFTQVPLTTAETVSTGSWKHARLETNMGNITIALDPAMPVTAGNFETLVEKSYYNGVIFHRVIDGFMIQGGDPTGTGRGGPGYTIKTNLPQTTGMTGGPSLWRTRAPIPEGPSSSSTSSITTVSIPNTRFSGKLLKEWMSLMQLAGRKLIIQIALFRM